MTSSDYCSTWNGFDARQQVDGGVATITTSDKLMPPFQHKVIVISGNSSIAENTKAINFAMDLARQGASVGIYNIVKSVGFLLMATGEAVTLRGPVKSVDIPKLLTDVDWSHLDYLVLDCPPGTGDETLNAVQTLGSAVIVSSPQQIELRRFENKLNCHAEMDHGTTGPTDYVSVGLCPYCGEKTAHHKSEKCRLLTDQAGQALLDQFQFDHQVVIDDVARESGWPAVEDLSAGSFQFQPAKCAVNC